MVNTSPDEDEEMTIDGELLFFIFSTPKFCNSDAGHAITFFPLFCKDSLTADEATPDWRSVPLPGSTPGCC